MTRPFLIFRLKGPMMAFGDITVGEKRSLWDAPSKSGVLGLLAACLGLDRKDHDALMHLDQAIGFAVRVDNAGRPLRDYHTAQAPKEGSKKNRLKLGLALNTRKDELECDDLNTVLSERLYRLEATATVALWVKPSHAYDLSALQSALKRPVYTPYLGRKACPLGAPPLPMIMQASDLRSALISYDEAQRAANKELKIKQDSLKQCDLWFEWDAGLNDEQAMVGVDGEVRSRRDALRNRTLWQFSDRQEGKIDWPPMPFGTEPNTIGDSA
jgi:CRISPR system Cascade subunit CasD